MEKLKKTLKNPARSLLLHQLLSAISTHRPGETRGGETLEEEMNRIIVLVVVWWVERSKEV